MQRTSFMLPADIKRRAEAVAKKQGLSLGEYFRQAIREKNDRQGKVDFFDFEAGLCDGPRDGSVRPEKYRFEPGRRSKVK